MKGRPGNPMSRVCLVTGGAGFIGCATSGDLADRFSTVIAIDNLHPQIHPTSERPPALDPRVQLVVASITDPSAWDRLLREVHPDVIIHLAAETGTGQSLTEATRHADVNVVGLTTMLDALSRHEARPSRIVLTSSRAVYGEGAWTSLAHGGVVYPGQRTREMLERAEWDFPGLRALPFEATKTTTNPTSVYGATKLAQEHILLAWGRAMGVETPILRLQNVYGPGQSLSNSYTGIAALFSRLAKEKRSIPVYEDGEIIRDFVYVTDVSAALLIVATHGPPSTAPYDVGLGERISILQLARLVAQIYGAPEPHVNGMYRHGDVRSGSCRVERTMEKLSWRPKINLENGLMALCKWIDDQV